MGLASQWDPVPQTFSRNFSNSWRLKVQPPLFEIGWSPMLPVYWERKQHGEWAVRGLEACNFIKKKLIGRCFPVKAARLVKSKLAFMEWHLYNLVILIKLYKIRCLNLDKALLFAGNHAICLKNWKLWQAPTPAAGPNLENQGSIRYCPKRALFWKKEPQKFHLPLFNTFSKCFIGK